ncbi:MAG: gliding motility protein GldN [Muribaculaceae bacterium]|jgi:gliding motility associated protien GldN|nr:gliding motility protein GldN [Muribaculaceae bacterium]
MKQLKKYLIIALVALGTSLSAVAQESSGSVVRRRGDNDRNKDKNASTAQVTGRMQQFFENEGMSDADVSWMKVVYRQLDLTKDKNAPLYYPEEPTESQENMFRIIMRLLANNQIAAYEYLDGREIFTDQYRIKVREMLDRFYILYTEAKGSTEKNPKFTIEESDVPSNEVLSYYLLEKWVFDTRSNRMKTQIEAVCPVLHRAGDFGGEPIRYPMFWIKFDALRPYLTQQYIFVDDDNNLPQYTYDDFFQLAMYDGDIYKTRNLQNKSMMQLYPDPDDMKRAQDSIQNRLEHFEDKLWVPSREEVIAAREAREQAAKGDTIVARKDDPTKEPAEKKQKSSRGSKKPAQKKESKVKESKPKAQSSSSSATRSVRRRK